MPMWVKSVETQSQKPGVWRRLADLGGLLGQMLFPPYAFAAETAGSLLPHTAAETDGIIEQRRVVEQEARPQIVEELQSDLSDLKPGVYTVTVAVKDLVTQERNSRSLTLQVRPNEMSLMS